MHVEAVVLTIDHRRPPGHPNGAPTQMTMTAEPGSARARALSTYRRLPEPLRRKVGYSARRLRLLAAPSVGRFLDYAPPGHFYSPLPTVGDLERVNPAAAAEVDVVPEIDLRADEQRALFTELAPAIAKSGLARSPEPGRRYHVDTFFSEGDASVYAALLQHLQPRRVIEIGSGFSSALLLDVADEHLPQLEATFVEPYPERLDSLLQPGDRNRVEVLQQPVQQVPLERFAALQENDILFIDSSHVVKVGSDVAHLLGEVLPVLAPGVVIHVHDIFWPFEYPLRWLRAGRAWNELYAMRAFLQNNDRYRILFFADWFVAKHAYLVREQAAPLAGGSASLWLRKVG
jgi:predicted O-methyltransferase YrrM